MSNSYLIGVDVLGAAPAKPAKPIKPPPSNQKQQVVARANAVAQRAAATARKLPSKFSAAKGKLSAAGGRLASKAQALQKLTKQQAAQQRGAMSDVPPPKAPSGPLTKQQAAQQRGAMSDGVAKSLAKPQPSAATRAAPPPTARQQRGIMGDAPPVDNTMAIVEASALTTVVDDLATLGDVISALSPIVAQLTDPSQSALAASGQKIVDRAQAVVTNYDPSVDPAAVSRDIDGQTAQIQTAATAWQAQAKAQAGVSSSTVSAQYAQQAQAIASAIAPVVAQLSAAGQTALATSGQAIVDRANNLASPSGGDGSYDPGSATDVARQQRGAM